MTPPPSCHSDLCPPPPWLLLTATLPDRTPFYHPTHPRPATHTNTHAPGHTQTHTRSHAHHPRVYVYAPHLCLGSGDLFLVEVCQLVLLACCSVLVPVEGRDFQQALLQELANAARPRVEAGGWVGAA